MNANLDRSLGSDRPEPAEIDRLITAAVSGYEKIRASSSSAG